MAAASTSCRPMAVRVGLAIGLALAADPVGAQPGARPPHAIVLEPCAQPDLPAEARCGVHMVFENGAGTGRRLPLRIIVLPARRHEALPDPVYHLAGGPGVAATTSAASMAGSWLRQDRDLVLVDQRGTGEGHRLDCETAAPTDDPRRFLEPAFTVERFAACRRVLEARADLRFYTTLHAVADLEEIRAGLGHERINLHGGSYGTRLALVYLRTHPDRIRTAILKGAVPLAFRNPLHHARAAQDALDGLLEDCAGDRACRAAFPDLRRQLSVVVSRLRAAPARVSIPGPNGEPVPVVLTLEHFAEGLRTMMYQGERGARVPLLIHRAWAGDIAPFAEAAVESNRSVRGSIRIGMLQSVVCSEDAERIREEDILRETRGTLLGDSRVRQQLAACGVWPRAELPADHAAPARADVPVLIFSGLRDPVTPPHWGAEAARHLSRSRHIVVPAGHAMTTPCVDRIAAAFLQRASVEALDVSCVAAERYPAFVLP